MFSLLYVDDEPGLLEIGQVFLEAGGDFSVTTALSGRAGLEHLARQDFDAIVSDFQMPEMDGIEFLKRVRQSFGNIPFILFTGRGREEIVIQAINHGVDFYLQKGGDPKAQFVELAHKVRQAVSRRRAETALSDSEKRLADIIDFLPDATFAIDSHGVVIAWNRAMERMTGVAKADMLGKGDYEYALPFYRERRPILINLVLEENPAFAARYPFIRKEGNTLFSEIIIPHFNNGRGAALWFTASRLYDRNGAVAGAIESIREITERKQAEEALNESERRFRELADLLPQGIYEAGTDGRMTYVNRLALEMSGYTAEDIQNGLNAMDVIAPADRLRAATVFRQMVEQGIRDHGNVEYLALRKDKSTFPVSIFSSPVYRDGRITGIRGVIIDITDRRRAEEKIQESELNYRLLFESSTEGILVAQGDRMVHVNPAMVTLLGYTADILTSKPFTEFIHPDDRKKVLSSHLERMRGGTPPTGYMFRLIGSGGEEKWVWINSTRTTWSGQPASLSFLTDMTEQKKAEERLVSANREYTSLLSQIQDVYYRTDREGRLVRASRSWATLFGYNDVSECIGMSIADGFYVNPGERKQVLEEIYRNGKITDYEVWVKKKDGTPVLIEASSHLYYDPPGTIAGVEGTFRDITQRKRAEEELRAANEQLAASAEELAAQYDELARNEERIRISEIRLRFMLGFYEMARKSERELLEYAVEGAGIVTESPLGYLAFLNEDESELAMQAWSRSAMAECAMRDKPVLYQTAKTGLWGEAVRQRRPVVTNDYAAPNPAKNGYPEGHPHIVRHMNVPVLDQGRIVLVAGVANKPSDYTDEDISELLLLMQGFWTILKRKRAEDEQNAALEQLAATGEELRAQYEELAAAQLALQSHKQQLEEIATTLPGVVYQFYARPDGSMGLYYVSSRASEVFGISSEPEDFFERFTEHVDPRDRETFIQSITDMARNGLPWHYEGRFVKPSKERIWFEGVSRPVRRGNELVYNGVLLDITDRRKADDELRLLKISADSSSDEVFWLDFAGNILYVNEAACRATGYTRGEFAAMKIFELDPDFPPGVWEASVADLRANKTQFITTRHRRKDGTIMNVEIVTVYVSQYGQEYSFAYVRDITERRRMEDALFSSQQMLQTVLDSIPERVFWKDRNSVFLGCNKPLALDAGFSDPAEIVGKTDYDHASRATADLYRADDRRVMETGEPRISYEEPQIRPDGSHAWLRTTKVPLRNREGSIIGVLGTYEDITQQKLAQEAVRDSEEKYRTLVESSFDGIAIHQDGTLVYVNRTAARLLGSEDPGVFIGKPAIDIVAPAFREQIAGRISAAPERSQQLLREQFLRVDGTPIDVDVSSAPGIWKGRPAAFITFRDITAQIRAEQALRESEEKFRALVETTSDFLWEVDAAGVYTYVSPQIRQILGYEPEELLGKTPFAIMPPDEAERVAGELNRCISSRVPIAALENRVWKKDGSIVILETSGTFMAANDGSFRGYRGIDRDITRRKQAEEALREKTEELDQYFTTSLDLFCIADTDGYFRRLNPEWERTLGYTITELEGKRFLDFVHPDDLPATIASIADLSSQKEVLNFTNRYRHKDGTYRWIEWRSYPRGNMIYAAARDITERYLAAERTARLSALKQDLLRTAPLEKKLRQIADAVVEIFGADFARIWMTGPGDLCDQGCIHAGVTGGPHVCRDRAHCLHLVVSSGRYTHTDGGHRRVPFGAYKIGRIATGDDARFITNDVTHDPRVHDHAWAESLGLVSFTGFRLLSSDGHPIGVFAFFSRKPVTGEILGDLDDLATTASQVIQTGLAEQALRESEARLSSILHGSPVLQFVIDRNHRVISWNRALEEYSGIRAEEIIGTDRQWEAFYPEKRPVLADLLVDADPAAISRYYAGKYRESRYVDGAYEGTDFFPSMGRSGVWLSFTAAPIRDVQGSIIGAVETLEDITERIGAETALRESETRYRHIIERMQDAYFRTDTRGNLTMVSPSAAVLYRYGSADEMVGIPAEALYSHREQRQEMLRQLEKQGRITNFIGEALRKDGSTFWASLNVQIITDSEGHTEGTEAIVRDVTDLKQMEHAVKLANRKLNLLTGITRHDILNKVSVVLGFLKIAGMKYTDPGLAQYLEKIESHVIAIRSQIEFTRVYENIGSHEPQWIELDSVLPRAQVPETVTLQSAVQGISVFSDPMLEKVFFNLLDNSIRHGQRVSKIRISARREGDDLIVAWEDDGAGIPGEEKERIFERGFGKHTGLGLFLSREILAITGISIRETGIPGSGARFEITVPAGGYRSAV